MITNEVQRVAHEEITFIGTIDRQFDDSFGREGAKIGASLRIRLPDEYEVTDGRAINVQDSTEVSTTLTMATQKHVAMRFNSAELFTDIGDFSKRKIQPAVKKLISVVESDVLQGCSKLVYNLAGTAGTAITDLTVPGSARAKLNQSLAPKSDRAIQMDSVTMGTIVNAMKGLNHPGKDISEQYREGFVARTSMADYYENERVWTMTNGTDIAFSLDTYTVVNGDADLTVTSFATPTAGMVFTLAGAYACHPETKAAYPHLQQFVILAGSTSTNLLISPAIYLTGARQNVTTSTGGDGSISTTAVGTCIGATSTSYVQNLMYYKDAFAFVTGDLPLMAGADKCVRKNVEGLSLRVWTDSDIRNDEQITRIDILYGYKAIRPEWACRMIGSAN
jgi:P22 coat protein - gene protein 5